MKRHDLVPYRAWVVPVPKQSDAEYHDPVPFQHDAVPERAKHIGHDPVTAS